MSETKALTLTPAQRVATVRDWIGTQMPEIAKAIPKHIDPIRFARVALTTLSNNPTLLECSRESLMACIMQTAAWGLDLDPVIGEAYVVPFNEKGRMKAKLILGYQGLIQLARRSDEVLSITPRAVYEKDSFTWEFGLEEKLVHRPYQGLDDPGALIAVYSVATMKDGSKSFDVMTIREVNSIRGRSRASNTGPWVTDFPAMAKKSVVRRHCKYLPKSVELASAIRLDEMSEDGVSQDSLMPQAVAIEDHTPALDKVTAKLKGKRQQALPEPEPEVVDHVDQETGEVLTGELMSPEESADLDRQLFGEKER